MGYFPNRPIGADRGPARLTDEQWNRIADRSLEIAIALGLEFRGISGDFARFGRGRGSLKVWFKGPHKGKWWDVSEKGDIVDLIRLKSGRGFIDAVEFALKERIQDPIVVKHKGKARTESDYDRTAFARQQWGEAKSVIGSLAETYLTVHRGIHAEAVHALDQADRIRFHPAHKFKPSDKWTAPALLVAATDLAGIVHGFQAIRLKADGSKRDNFAKASAGDLAKNRAIGWLSGGNDVICGEGPEDGVTLYEARPEAMIGAAFGGMKRLLDVLPPAPRRIILAVQNDAIGSDAAKQFPEVCEHLTAAGYDIWIARPPSGIKDANDLLRERGIDAVRSMLDAAQPFLPPPGPSKDKFDRCEPSSTAPKTTASEAFSELKTAFHPTWTNQILPAVQERRTWEVEAAAAEEDGVSPPDHPLMPHVGLAPGMGIGKTEIVIQAAKSTQDIRTAMFTPTHALAGDVERRINDLEAEGAGVWKGIERPDPEAPGCFMCRRLCAVKLMMASGGSATDLCGNKNKGFCQHHPKHPNSGTPGFDVCGTQRQNLEMAADQNQVVVMPHAMLGNPPPAALRRSPVEVPFANRKVTAERSAFDVTIIDEAPWLSMVKVRSARIDLSDLNRSYVDKWQVPARPGEDQNFAGRRLREISVRTHDVLAEAYDKTAFVRLTKSMFSAAAVPLTSDMCDEAYKLTWRLHIDPAQQTRPDMTDDEVSHALRPIIQHNRIVRRTARLWKSLSEFLAGNEELSPYLMLTPRAEKDADDEGAETDDAEAVKDQTQGNVPTGKTIPSIALSWRVDIHPDWLTGPIIFADGTMNETLSRYWLPNLNVVCRVQASTPRSVYRRQVIDRPVSHHMICPKKTDRIDKNEKTRRNHAADLARLIELRSSEYRGRGRMITEADGSRTRIDAGFIVPMALEDYWRDNGMVPDDPAIEVHHSGNVRGMTRLEVVAHQTVISRTLTGPAATEELAWVISGRVGQSLPEGEWYPTRDAGVLMRDGSGRKVKQVYHPDPIAEAVRWQICEGNVLQDEARGRAARRNDDTPLTIDIITNVALPLEVDEVVTYADLMAEVDPVSMSLARGMVAFDWQGVGLVCRDMFRSSNDLALAARVWGTRHPDRRAALDQFRSEIKGAPPVTNSLYRDSSYKEFVTPPPSDFRVYRYRPAGTGALREMAISDMHADPKAAMEQIAGPLDLFEPTFQEDPAAFEPDEPVVVEAATVGRVIHLDTVGGIREMQRYLEYTNAIIPGAPLPQRWPDAVPFYGAGAAPRPNPSATAIEPTARLW